MLRLFGIVLFASLSLFSQVQAGVLISNHSFESPVVGIGSSSGIVTGWEQAGVTGVFRGAGNFGQAALPVDGVQIAYLNAGNGILRQTLSETYGPGSDYLLSVSIANRFPFDGVLMDLVLYAGSNQSKEVGRRSISSSLVPDDVFGLFSLSVTSSQIASVGAMGQNIRIAFESRLGSEIVGTDFDLDNVTLTSTTAVPEPFSFALWSLGGSIALFARVGKTKRLRATC